MAWGMVKLRPLQQAQFVAAHPRIYAPVAGGWGVRGATGVRLKLATRAAVRPALFAPWRHRAAAPARRIPVVAGPRMMRSLLLACLIASAANAVAAPRAGHPLVGLWRLAMPGFACRETIEFRADGTSASTSALEEASGAYEVSDRAAENGRYVLSASITGSNGGTDCFGETAPVGVPVTSYVQIYPGDRLFFCPDSTSTACFGPYLAVPRKSTRGTASS